MNNQTFFISDPLYYVSAHGEQHNPDEEAADDPAFHGSHLTAASWTKTESPSLTSGTRCDGAIRQADGTMGMWKPSFPTVPTKSGFLPMRFLR
jgi:hypothetical protein